MGELAVEVGGYDHRRFPRRRGKVLEQAIGDAVVEELAERGYTALTFEGVAARAGTGKSTLYRRWADKPSMVVDCLTAVLPGPDDHPPTGDLREDLVNVLEAYATSCAGTIGVALRAVCGDAVKSPELQTMWRERAAEPRLAAIRSIIQAAVDRGEARPGALEPECILAGPAMIGQIYMATDNPPTRDEVRRVVDHVLVPMYEAR
ncbi:TetR/AcrR family transcriptional regulator [Yinghuangia soli]|uniref:TetR/AcrR family transcriptional regulator n=1 Tax=Yinghuangia soli TaxID=2908204 RepID=A0AA41PY81_9ACTN|nr:TetR/AcrR family transcriptional regulator [Yinghuangia soli]MCF2527797.1 TetR/AcrR family transcriptional regulator [Yinghuangia soli]